MPQTFRVSEVAKKDGYESTEWINQSSVMGNICTLSKGDEVLLKMYIMYFSVEGKMVDQEYLYL